MDFCFLNKKEHYERDLHFLKLERERVRARVHFTKSAHTERDIYDIYASRGVVVYLKAREEEE